MLRKDGKRLVFKQNTQWINRMTDNSQSALLERMTLFWHGHFACITKMPHLAARQMNTIRAYALGSFKDLVLAMAKDVSMIRFLNNQQNRKKSPNENFARELMELFTIGQGNYTEQDIKEAARAFTGWSSNLRGEFIFKERQHDYGQKTFMGRTGDFNGDDIINIILEQKEAAEFITRKIYSYFVNEKVDEFRVKELAKQFYDTNYNISYLMGSIFRSDWFYAEKNVGTKIKSPVEFLAGMLRSLNVSFEDPMAMLFVQKALGQVLFNPPNVAGWAGGKIWIDNSTLMLRLNLANYLFRSTDIDLHTKDEFEAEQRGKKRRKIKAEIDFSELLSTFKYTKQEQIFEKLSAYILQPDVHLNKSMFDEFTPKGHNEDFIKVLTMWLMSLPEYQMC